MHYIVYVLCNRARNLFFLGITGGFTDAIFEADFPLQEQLSFLTTCTQLVHHRKFKNLDGAADYLEALQHDIKGWRFKEIENRNRHWRDLTDQWINPTRLLSFQAIRNSYYCSAN